MKNFLIFTLFLFVLGPGVISDKGKNTGENQINAEDGSISTDTSTGSITPSTTTPTTTKPSTATTTTLSTATTTTLSTATTPTLSTATTPTLSTATTPTLSTATTPTLSTATTTVVTPTTPPYPPAETGDLKINTWHTSCIVARMGVKFTFVYTAENAMKKNITLNMPNGTQPAEEYSTCGPDYQTLCIPFYADWFFNITFKKDILDFSVSELGLTFSMNSHYFPNISKESLDENAALYNLTDMSSKINSSYQCYNHKPVTFSGEVKLQSIEFAKLQLEAFRNSNTSEFSPPIPCAADTEINNIVPIAVGAALGGLVIIVLIAYLIGRKRSRRGYESV